MDSLSALLENSSSYFCDCGHIFVVVGILIGNVVLCSVRYTGITVATAFEEVMIIKNLPCSLHAMSLCFTTHEQGC